MRYINLSCRVRLPWPVTWSSQNAKVINPTQALSDMGRLSLLYTCVSLSIIKLRVLRVLCCFYISSFLLSQHTSKFKTCSIVNHLLSPAILFIKSLFSVQFACNQSRWKDCLFSMSLRMLPDLVMCLALIYEARLSLLHRRKRMDGGDGSFDLKLWQQVPIYRSWSGFGTNRKSVLSAVLPRRPSHLPLLYIYSSLSWNFYSIGIFQTRLVPNPLPGRIVEVLIQVIANYLSLTKTPQLLMIRGHLVRIPILALGLCVVSIRLSIIIHSFAANVSDAVKLFICCCLVASTPTQNCTCKLWSVRAA